MVARLIRTATLTVCLAFATAILAQDNRIHPRIISVTGSAEIKVPPDQVTVVLGVQSHERELAVAKAHNDRSVKKLLTLAHHIGVDTKNIQTSALSMGPEYSNERIPKLLSYEVSQVITITLTDLSKYEELLTGALNAGVNRVDGINFVVADAKRYREEARLNAVKAAREKARAIATELGQTVGKPWEISEDADYATVNRGSNSLMYVGALPEQEAAPTIAGGEVTIRASVHISFELD